MKSLDGGLFSNIKGLTYYKDNEDDPYITLKEVRMSLRVCIISDEDTGGRRGKGRTPNIPYR